MSSQCALNEFSSDNVRQSVGSEWKSVSMRTRLHLAAGGGSGMPSDRRV